MRLPFFLRLSPVLCFLTCCLLVPNVVAQQTDPPELTVEEAAVVSLSKKFHRKLAHLELYESSALLLSEGEEAALQYRRDRLALDLISETIAIAEAVSNLPTDNVIRQSVEDDLRENLNDLEQKVIHTLTQHNIRINDAAQKLPDLAGSDLFQAKAYIDSLQKLRYQTLKTMAQVIPTLNALGIPTATFQQQAELILIRQAERLVGLLEFSAAAATQISNDSAVNPNDTNLVVAHSEIQNRHARELEQLSEIIEALKLVGVKTDVYQAIVVKQRGLLSVDIFKGRVFQNIIRDYWDGVLVSLQENGPNVALKTIFILLIFLGARWLSALARRAAKAAVQRSPSGLSQLHKNVLISISSGVVMGVGILLILGQLGISLGPMLAGLGIAGFIVGFALQDSLANFAAGGMILLYKPFDVDDFVQVAGQEGLVKKMSLVSTTIHTFDNVTAQRVRRVDLEFGVSYSSDIEQVERILAEVVKEHPKVLPEPEPNIRVQSLGDSSVNFIARPWAAREDVWNVRWDLIRAVKLRFDQEGIEIPFPQRDIHLSYSEPSILQKLRETPDNHQGKE
jgi:small conductance mechanosensitive channel